MRIFGKPQQFSDRARRAAGAVTMARLVYGEDLTNKWMALRLSDGGCDGNVYATKADAIRHQIHPKQCAYICVPPDGASERGMETFLRFTEGLYEAGADLADPDKQINMPGNREHIPGLLRAVRRGR